MDLRKIPIVNIEIFNNEALSLAFNINTDLSANTFYMEIRDTDQTLKETVTLTDSYTSPKTYITGLMTQSEVEALGVGSYIYDIVMYSTFPTVLFRGSLVIKQGVTQLP